MKTMHVAFLTVLSVLTVRSAPLDDFIKVQLSISAPGGTIKQLSLPPPQFHINEIEVKMNMTVPINGEERIFGRNPNPWLDSFGSYPLEAPPLPPITSLEEDEEGDSSSLPSWFRHIFPPGRRMQFSSSEEASDSGSDLDSIEKNSTPGNESESNARTKRSTNSSWYWLDRKQQAGNDWQAWRTARMDFAKQWRENNERREAAKAAVKKEKEEAKLLKERIKAEKKLWKNEVKSLYRL